MNDAVDRTNEQVKFWLTVAFVLGVFLGGILGLILGGVST